MKSQLYKHILEILEGKINITKEAIAKIKESRDSNTKSSVGDKYETDRAMMQREIENLHIQLSNHQTLINDLQKINLTKAFSKVEFGSLVETNHETYFISVGLGKIDIDNKPYYAISLASPIGKILFGKSVGEIISFQQRELEILSIG